MKKILFFIFILGLTNCASFQSRKEKGITVSTLLNQIQIAINEIHANTKNTSLPPFKSAELKLSTEAEKSKSGEASFVLSCNRSRSDKTSNTITLVLVPNDGSEKDLGIDSQMGHEIADSVIAAVTAIDNKGFLKLETLTVESGLRVSEKKGAGLKIELIGITIKGGSSSESTNSNSLKLIFSKGIEQQ